LPKTILSPAFTRAADLAVLRDLAVPRCDHGPLDRLLLAVPAGKRPLLSWWARQLRWTRTRRTTDGFSWPNLRTSAVSGSRPRRTLSAKDRLALLSARNPITAQGVNAPASSPQRETTLRRRPRGEGPLRGRIGGQKWASDRLSTHGNLFDFFHERVDHAVSECHVPVSRDGVYYITTCWWNGAGQRVGSEATRRSPLRGALGAAGGSGSRATASSATRRST
jgi:hypothetical protein